MSYSVESALGPLAGQPVVMLWEENLHISSYSSFIQ